MEMNRKDIKHQLALMAQDRIFCRNAHIQQKILGALLAVCSMVVWITLTMYDAVQIWWGVELFPLMCIGFYLMLTKNNYIWNLYRT